VRPSSIYAAECFACGTQIESETQEAKCPKCGVVTVLEFGVRHEIGNDGEVRASR